MGALFNPPKAPAPPPPPPNPQQAAKSTDATPGVPPISAAGGTLLTSPSGAAEVKGAAKGLLGQ
jgi:hypothetical protein